jgi:hypothetical protein
MKIRPELTLKPPSIFKSFWIAGFEAATHRNSKDVRLDMIHGVQHDVQAESDYALIKTQGMQCARDGVRWHLIDRGNGQYDFCSLIPMLEAARRQQVHVIWDLCHYGWPDDLDLFSTAFPDRFARFSAELARVVCDHTEGVPFFCPMNEINFFAWAASKRLIFPHAKGRDGEIKRQLIRASVACVQAVWDVAPQARMVYAEPLIHVVAPLNRPSLTLAADRYNESQYEAWDMIAGRVEPELGGDPRYLDILGLNYYHSNQWQHPKGRLRWEDEPRDPRWIPFHDLLERAYRRFGRPVLVAETSHFGSGRARWIREMAEEVYQSRLKGVPVEAVCLYPILDRFDWEDSNHWHNSGLWDLRREPDGSLRRVLNQEYAEAFAEARQRLASIGCV